MPKLSIFEVRGDRVIGLSGDDTEKARGKFASDAESLQGKAFLIAKSIGMSAVTCAAASVDDGGLAFRFAGSSSDAFDVKGVATVAKNCSTASLIDHLA